MSHIKGISVLILFISGLFPEVLPQEFWIPLEKPTTLNLNKLDFVDSLTGWVVGDSGLIIKTVDGGQSWIFQDSGVENDINDIFMLDENLGWALALKPPDVINPNYGTIILKTSNGGADWGNYFFENKFFFAIDFLDSLNGWMGGDQGLLYKTSDGGSTWVPANVDSTVFSGFSILNFKFFSSQYGFAMGGHIDIAGVFWKTTDNGNFWTVQGIAPEPIHDLHFLDSLNILAVSGDFDFGSGIVKTTDGGVNWQYIYLGIFGEAQALAFRNDSEAWAPLGFTGTYMYTQDAGNSWSDLYTPDSSAMYDVTFASTNTGFMVGDRGTILKYNSGVMDISHVKVVRSTSPELYQNYPNPFNPVTTIKYNLKGTSQVYLTVFDLGGKRVKTFLEGTRKTGSYEIRFDGKGLASGIYFYKFTAQPINAQKPPYTQIRKMILLK